MVPLGSLQAFLGWGSTPQRGQLAVLEVGAAVTTGLAHDRYAQQFNSMRLVRALRTSSVHLMRQIAHNTATHVRLRNLRKNGQGAW